jgi:CheY-like chemotaxis protein
MSAATRSPSPSGPLGRPVPRQRPGEPAAPAKSGVAPAAQHAAAAAASARMVFLLDDEPIVQAIVKTVLERAGYRVLGSPLWSDVGREVMAVRETSSTVLVSDLNLPGIRGEDFCRTILKYRPGLDLVLYTGVEAEEARAAARRLGPAVRWVLKREGPERLCEVVRELELGRSS